MCPGSQLPRLAAHKCISLPEGIPVSRTGAIPMKRLLPGLLLLTLLVSLTAAFSAPRAAHAAPVDRPAHLPYAAWLSPAGNEQVMRVNMRSAPSTGAPIVARQTIGTPISIYAVVTGTAVLADNPYWYRISPAKAQPQFVYSQYVSTGDQLSATRGKLIVVSLSNQWLIALDNGRRVLDTPVTTGRPELPTPAGTFHILAKYQHYTFISPWPQGSPFYYPPSLTNYALQFRGDGYFIHDAPWRTQFGPGTNLPHDDPGDPLGSHGCVNVPLSAAKALYTWAGVGTTVRIVQ
jgi:lipoprotein-anchoring transpeptidase ErfK/SrfK